jgi:RhtB (resistance to homoserine/threonine) family protein
MLGTHDLSLFVVSGLLLNITPGADSLFIVTRSASHGFRAGVLAALGIGLGCCIHIAAAALGLSAVLATSSAAFTVVKFAGAAYLIYIGWSLLRTKPQALSEVARVPAESGRMIFVQGLLTNVLNPKVAIFFLAFVPQFIDPSASNKPLAFLFLGALFNLNGTLWCVLLAFMASRAKTIRVRPTVTAWLSRSVGAIFIVLGVRLALSRQA